MGIYRTSVTADASGDGTSAVWSGRFRGLLYGVRVDATGGAATTDTTLTEPVNGRTILTVTDSQADDTYVPAQDIDGATDAYLPYYVEHTDLLVTVAQAGDGGVVDVYVTILEQ